MKSPASSSAQRNAVSKRGMDDVAQDARGRSAGAVAGGINAETARGMRVCAERQRQLMNAESISSQLCDYQDYKGLESMNTFALSTFKYRQVRLDRRADNASDTRQ